MESVFAVPREVSSLDECFFYHTMDVPGFGTMQGEWDLRGHEAEYLGNIDLRGKRVMDVGTASGFLSFYMEKQGAEVVSYDLSDDFVWDVVPFHSYDYQDYKKYLRGIIRKLNNSYWLSHKAENSHVKMVNGSVYEYPAGMGHFDTVVFGSILLHLRDPLYALEKAAELAPDSIVVTDVLFEEATGPTLKLLPDPERTEPRDAWWMISPQIIERFLQVLGFPYTTFTRHFQSGRYGRVQLFTVIGSRTAPAESRYGRLGHLEATGPAPAVNLPDYEGTVGEIAPTVTAEPQEIAPSEALPRAGAAQSSVDELRASGAFRLAELLTPAFVAVAPAHSFRRRLFAAVLRGGEMTRDRGAGAFFRWLLQPWEWIPRIARD